MTSRRDLGPVLGVAAAAAALAAVVVGFVVVGGPGDARSERFDQMTMERLETISHAARCVMTVSGSAPRTREALVDRVTSGVVAAPSCEYIDVTQIEASDEIEYAALGASMIRLCATFRLPHDADDQRPGATGPMAHPEFEVERPAGRHCFDVRLRPIASTPTVDTPYPPEETAEPVEAPPIQ